MGRSSGGNVDLAIPGAQDRNGQMGRRSEPEEAYTVARLDACHTKASKPYNAGA